MKYLITLTSGILFIVLVVITFGCKNSIQLNEINNSIISNTSTSNPNKTPQLSDEDKIQIITEILKTENLRDAKKKNENSQNIIYIEGHLPIKQIPQIQGLEVKFLSFYIEAKLETEIVSYEFRDFETKDSKIVIPIIWNKRDSSSKHSAIIEYACKKISNKWSVEGTTVGVSVAESK